MDKQQYLTAQRKVEAAQVTEENMNELAGWCGGRVQNNGGRPHVKITVARSLAARFGQGYAGDWIVRMGKSFRIYTNENFLKNFDPIFDIGTPVYDLVLNELRVGRETQRPDEQTARRLTEMFKHGDISVNDYRRGMGMPEMSEGEVTPKNIMGRPYVQPVEGTVREEYISHRGGGEVSLPTFEIEPEMKHIDPRRIRRTEEFASIEATRELKNLGFKRPKLPENFFEVMHEGVVKVDDAQDLELENNED